MIKILFVCHGNICRSPMAEFVTKDMVKRLGREEDFLVESAATSSEELGNGVYPPIRRLLASHGISCEGKTARRLEREDYDRFDLILVMDEENMVNTVRRLNGDPEGKVHNLLDFAGRIGEEIPDPWYTRQFEDTWEDVTAGCLALLNALNQSRPVTLDFSACEDRKALYRVMRAAMLWQEDYGSNLDALYDILTGLPYYGSSFRIIPPENEALLDYTDRIADIFEGAGVPVEIC